MLHIERLVLDGLPVTSAEGTRIREAVESELLKLFAAGQLSGEFARGGARPLVNAPQITFDPRRTTCWSWQRRGQIGVRGDRDELSHSATFAIKVPIVRRIPNCFTRL